METKVRDLVTLSLANINKEISDALTANDLKKVDELRNEAQTLDFDKCAIEDLRLLMDLNKRHNDILRERNASAIEINEMLYKQPSTVDMMHNLFSPQSKAV